MVSKPPTILRLIQYSLNVDNVFGSKSYFLSQIALISREFSRTLLESCSFYLYDW